MTPDTARAGRLLTKSRFVSGLQCERRLWWEHHEPDAPELVPDAALEALFEHGRHVGALARERFPGGVLIDVPYTDPAGRVQATREALASGAAAVIEAAIEHDGAFAAVDVLLRDGDGWRVIEVKMSTEVKDEHVPDVAFQVLLAERSGLAVTGAELMHLDRECRHPDLLTLFVREDITALVRAALGEIDASRARFQDLLRGSIPEVAPSKHCGSPFDCPFRSRCWAGMPEHHLYTLYRARQDEVDALEAEGASTIADLPPRAATTAIRKRQVAAVRSGRIQVSPDLRQALFTITTPAVYLDFETIWPAIPVWPGMRPYDQAVVQISAHRDDGTDAPIEHAEWLADGPADPRRDAAEQIIALTAGASSVVVYNANFERLRIEEMEALFPDLAPALAAVRARLVDQLPIVRDHVYHPAFRGSFSIKAVLPALVPEESYDGMEIAEAGAASAALERVLFDRDGLTDTERAELRRALLVYCRMDTWAMVALHRALAAFANGPRS